MATTARSAPVEEVRQPVIRSGLLGRSAKRRLGVATAYLVVGLWALFSVFPVFWTYFSSIKASRDVFALPPKWVFTPTLDNYKVVLGLIVPTEQETVQEEYEGAVRSKLPDYILNTVVVSASSALLTLIVGCPAAYALARSRMRGRRLILTGILVTQMIPPIVLLIPFYRIWGNVHLLDTHLGLILAFFTLTLPFVIWMMRGFFQGVPAELEDAAMIDGASRWGALARIALPLAAPGLATTAIFTVLFTWNEFLLASVLGGEQAKLLTPSIFGYVSDRSVLWGQLYAASSLVLLPVVVFTLLVQRHIVAGLTGGALKG
jgi:multiple sugar transport system permease protein